MTHVSQLKIVPLSQLAYPSDFPPEEFHRPISDMTQEQLTRLSELVQSDASETDLDAFIRKNPVVLTATLRAASTGHHGAWVLSQPMIRNKIRQDRPGLIPDYIVGGKSSDGFEWWVVELKGANAKLFTGDNKRRLHMSSTLNRGICQLLSYTDYCAEIQSTLRDEFGLTHFREPKGLILIGREQELEDDEQKQKLKAAWNRAVDSSLEIRTFDSLLRAFAQDYQSWNKLMREMGRGR